MSGINLPRADVSYMGEGTVYPATAKNGATFYRTDLYCLMIKANGTWIQLRDATVANVTQLNSIPTAVAGVGFKVYQQDINVLYLWNGTYWTILGGTQPSIRVYRSSGTGYLSASAYFVVPYNAQDTSQTFNPNGDWFEFRQGERRILIKRPGLYQMTVNMRTDSNAAQYIRLFISNNTGALTTGTNLAAYGPNTNALMNVSSTWRFAAGDHVAVMLLSPGSDVADNSDTQSGYRNDFVVTRLSD